MDISQLEAFIAVSQTLNFTRASEHLHISQSAVTARIKALEDAVGKPLFMRDNRNVSLTQAGIAFLSYADRMLRLFQESKLTLSEQFDDYIVLSGPGAVWHYQYLERILAFRRSRPNAAVKFLSYIDSSYMIRDLLLDGTVHIAVRYDPPDHPKVTRTLLFEDEILLVSAEEGRHVRTADFFSPSYCHIDWGPPFPEWFSAIVGPGYIPALQTDHSAIMLTMLLQGSVFGFLPRSIAQPLLDSRKLHQLSYGAPAPTLRLYASYLTENSGHPSVKLGLDLLGLQQSDAGC